MVLQYPVWLCGTEVLNGKPREVMPLCFTLYSLIWINYNPNMEV